jgi:hypothetical protein
MARATYLKRMMDKFELLATWLPGQVLSLGSIGVLDRGAFHLKTSLDALGIDFKSLSGQSDLDFEHQHGATISFKASAGASEAVTGARATASLKFGSQEGFVFRARKCVEQVIGDMADVEQEIFELVRQKIWKDEWIVVNRLYRAACSTIIVAGGNAAEVQIEGHGAGPFDLADAALDLRVASKSGDVTTFVAASELTPLYQATRIDSSWWRGPKARQARSTLGDDEMVPVSLADAIASTPTSQSSSERT